VPIPTRAPNILDTLPTLYYQDPVTRRVVDTVAGRLAVAQADLEQVLHAHWVDTADASPTPAAVERPLDLTAIAALVPLTPLPDEEAARRTPERLRVDAATIFDGPPGDPLTFERLLVGQEVVAGGSRADDGSVLVQRLAVGRPLPAGFSVVVQGLIAGLIPPSAVDPVGTLHLLAGRSGAEMFRQRLKLTTAVFLDGVGTAPAVLKMAAATMGWGQLLGTIADWSAEWSPQDPVFRALAEGAPGAIRLRELPLQAATTPTAQRVKSGARWTETGGSSFIVQPTIQITALDLPVFTPTIVSLDTQAAIEALVTLDTIKLEGEALIRQEVTLKIRGEPDGTLSGELLERRLPSGEVTVTDISDRIRVRSPGLRVDAPGPGAVLSGGADGRPATLVVSDGHRAVRLSARADGIWGNAIRVGHASGSTLELRFDPNLAIGQETSEEAGYLETATLDELLEGASRLVTAEDFTFTIPEGPSRWLYFDHAGPAAFDTTQWDLTVFDAPEESDNLDNVFAIFPAKGTYDYASFEQSIFPQEFLRAFRWDQAASRFDEAAYNETSEQVEVLLGWQEGQRATIRLDVPLQTASERARLAVLPEMLRQVKPAGVKVILGQPLQDLQPLGEVQPRVHPLMSEQIDPGEAVRLRLAVKRTESPPPIADHIIGTMNSSFWNLAQFE
jgi:hypothetical protein